MAENKEEKIEQEVTPAWVKNLQDSLDSLPSKIKEALTPEEPATGPEEPKETEPLEIPVPEAPQVTTPEPEPLETPQEKPKRKSLWDWLM